MTLGNMWTNKTPRQVNRTGVYGSIPIYSPIYSRMRKSLTLASSDSSVTMIPIGTSEITTDPPCGLNIIPNIGNIWKSATPDLRNPDKFDTSIDGKFTDNLVAPPILTVVLSDKLSSSYSLDLYERVGMRLTEDPTNSVTLQFVDLGLSTTDTLDKGAGLWTPATRVERQTDVTHWISLEHIYGETTAVGDTVSLKSDYDNNYNTDLEIWKENKEFEHKKNARSRTPLDLTPVGTKTLDAKYHLFNRLMLVIKLQTAKHQQRTCQNAKKKRKKIT